jgi:phenylpyruvate tautomerase PptA (4-oxalocrotonate tautomerase family)
MPLLKLETTTALSDDQKKTVLPSLSKIVSTTIGKPEQYVMVTAGPVNMLMSGKPGDAAFVDVRSIGGLSPDVTRKLSEQVCKLLNDSLKIAPERIFLNFTDMQAGNWGWNGSTIG